MQKRDHYNSVITALGYVIGSIGLLGLLGWVIDVRLLASISNTFIPMAPDTAIIFIVFGLFVIMGVYKSANQNIITLSFSVLALLTFYSLLKVIEFFTLLDLTFENNLFPVTDRLGSFPLRRMSPITGFLFFISGISFITVLMERTNLKSINFISGLGFILLFSGFTAVIGYLFGSPLLYGSRVIPLALTTAFAFLFLGLLIIMIAGKSSFIARPLSGNSPSQMLLRIIIPIVLLIILVQGLMLKEFADSENINNAIISAILSLVFIIITGFAIIRVSKLVFKNAYALERKQKEAEEIILLKEDLLKLTGKMAKVGGWEFDAITLKGTWTDEVAIIHDLDPNHPTSVELGMSFYRGDSQLKIEKAIKEAVDHAKPYDLELELVSAKGNHKWVRTIGFPVKKGKKVVKVQGILQDITERKNIEKVLKVSEERYRLIVQNQGEGIGIVDINENFVFANPAAEQIFEVHSGELINRNLKDFVIPNQLSLLHTETEKRSKGEKSTYELNIITSNGNTKILFITATPQLTDKGIHTGAFAVFRDITERKQVELALKERVKEIQCLQSISSIIDKESLTLGKFFNKVINLVLLGMQYPEKTGCRLTYKDQTFQTNNYIQNKYTISSDLVIKNKRYGKIEVGSIVEHPESYQHLFLEEEKEMINTITKMVSDFVERKRNEQIQKVIYNISTAVNSSEDLVELIGLIKYQLSSLIDTTNFYVALYDEITNTITLPYHKDQKDKVSRFPVGKTLTNHLIKTQKPLLATNRKIDELVESGLIEYFGVLAKIWLGVPLIVKGKVIGVLAVQSYEDVNAYNYEDLDMLEFVSSQISLSVERKRVEQDILNALEKAKESDRLKSTFLATMSHELRTPLNAVIGFSEMLQEDQSNQNVKEFGSIINKSGLNLLAIIEDIFEITLIESGEVNLTNSEFNLKSLMDEIYNFIEAEQLRIDKKNLRIIYSPAPWTADIILNTDKSKVKHIFVNLLKNALKFTLEGSVEFGVEKDERNGIQYIKFYVKDTGIGISEGDKKIIFENFRQIDDTNTRLFGGTGIGLSVAKKYTNLIGGDIWVESTPDEGSTFFFTVPYREPQIIIKPKEQRLDSINPLKFSGKTILIAEDEVSNYELLMLYLDSLEVKTLWAKDGEETISLCESNSNIDLILMDIKMPKINGLEATSIIRKTHPDLPIIAQTAFVLHGDDKKAYDAGCNDYIGKPIKRKDLYAMLSKYLMD